MSILCVENVRKGKWNIIECALYTVEWRIACSFKYAVECVGNKWLAIYVILTINKFLY